MSSCSCKTCRGGTRGSCSSLLPRSRRSSRTAKPITHRAPPSPLLSPSCLHAAGGEETPRGNACHRSMEGDSGQQDGSPAWREANRARSKRWRRPAGGGLGLRHPHEQRGLSNIVCPLTACPCMHDMRAFSVLNPGCAVLRSRRLPASRLQHSPYPPHTFHTTRKSEYAGACSTWLPRRPKRSQNRPTQAACQRAPGTRSGAQLRQTQDPAAHTPRWTLHQCLY